MSVLRVLVLVAVCVSSGAALKCYICVSDEDEYCSDSELWKGRVDPVDCPLEHLETGLDAFDSIARAIGIDFDASDSSQRPRGPLALVCQKNVYSNPRGKRRTERKCALKNANPCRDAGRETVNGRLDYCRTCAFDGCNAAGHLNGSYLWPLLLLALLRWH